MSRNGPQRDQPRSDDPLEELGALLPGDVIDVWMESPYVVKTVLLCREEVAGRPFEWRWMFLDDGSLVEVSPDGYFRYQRHEVVKQGSPLYEELVAQDGALVRFEQRVRDDTVARRPVHVSIEGKRYRIASTGVVTARRLGEEPGLLPWQSFGPRAEDNVYFGMVDVEDEENAVLGLWTAHVCLSFGREIAPAEISAIYRR